MTDASPILFVTGAGGGIGSAICELAVSRGWRVAAADLDLEAAERTAAAHPDAILPIGFDVADAAEVDRAFALVESTWGPVRAAVNNAGFADQTPFSQITQEQWTREFDVMVSGAIHVIRRAMPNMAGLPGSSVVNIVSVNGMGFYSHPTYSASKAALISLTGSLAALYGHSGVRINAIAPGTVITPIWGTPDVIAERTAPLLPYVPLNKMAVPHDIAEAVLFLVSDAAGQITGATLPVDGGLTTGILPVAHLISGRE